MKRVKQVFVRIWRLWYTKYVVTIVLGVLIVGFLDENSVWRHLQHKQRIDELNREISEFASQHRHNQQQIEYLDSTPKAIEKIARERYFMKADGEDIFVLSDDKR